MFNLRSCVVVLLFFTFSIQSTWSQDQDCGGEQSLQTLSSTGGENLTSLNQVAQSTVTRQDLLSARISHSGVKITTADIYVRVSEGKIVDLNVSARVKLKLLGIDEQVFERVSLDQLMRGQPLEFSMNGADQPILIIEPGRGISADGGRATLKIWNGNSYDEEVIAMTNDDGAYHAYHQDAGSSRLVSGLNIRMGGFSLSGLHVANYSIKTN